MSNALLWLGGLLVAVLCALFAVPHVVDWNRYRGVFEEEASRMLGREVRVDGGVNLRLLPVPFVQFGKVHVANGEGAVGEPLIRAESFTLWLAVGPLLRGAIQANEIALKRPVLKLRTTADGTGNWQNLSIGRGSLAFLPSDVSLQSIRVTDGIVAVSDAGGREIVRLDAIAGEASAGALEGPYKFRFDLNWNGEPREIKGATTKAEADGAVRVRLAVRVARTGSTYALDGRLSDPAGKPRLDGELTAKVPLQAGAQAAAGAKRYEGPVFDLKSRIEADASGGVLPDVTLSFEKDGRPQSLTGRAALHWRDTPAMTLDMAAKWLDLDRVAAHATNPGEALRDLLLGIVGEMPAEGRLAVRIGVDQVNLGGEAVSGARLVLERAGNGPMLVQELAGAVPGGSRVSVSGVLAGARPAIDFDGEVNLRGASLGRFLNWLHRGQTLIQNRGDGPFALRSRLRLGTNAVTLSDAKAEFGSTIVAGGLAYVTDPRRTLELTLDGNQIDISALAPGVLDRTGIAGLIGAARPGAGTQPAAGKTAAAAPARIDLADADVVLKVKAGQLTDGERRLRDVTADIALRGGALQIADLRLGTDTGLQLEAQGEISDVTGRPKGRLRGTLAAPGRPAAIDAARLLELSEAWTGDGSILPALTPGRVAYDLRLGERGESAIELGFDGQAIASPVRGSIRLDAGFESWRTGPIGATVTAAAIDLARVTHLATASGEPPAGRDATAAKGRVLLRATGASANNLAMFAQVTSPGLDVALTGQTSLADPRAVKFSGQASLDVSDLRRAIAAFGLRHQPAVADLAVAGLVGIEGADRKWAFEPRQLAVGGAPVSGKVSLQSSAGLSRIDARLAVAELAAPLLLTPLLDGRAGSEAARGGDPSVWPAEPIEFGPLAGIEGRVRLEVGALRLADAVAARNVTMDVELAPDRLEITRLEGGALGGSASGTLRLDRMPGGARMTTTVRLTGLNLDALAKPAAVGGQSAGKADLTLVATSRGASPRALVAALTGKGEAQLSGGRIGQFGPAAVSGASDAAIAGRIDVGDPFREELLGRLRQSPLGIARTRVPLEVVDGALRFRALAIDAAEGAVTNQTTVELASLKLDSEWRIEPKAVGGKAALPGISIVYVGPIGQLDQVQPRLATDALERELKVRRMERDVDALERLRREDEERSRLEAERRAALSAQGVPATTTDTVPLTAPGISPAAGPADPQPASAEAIARPPAGGPEAPQGATEPRRRAQSPPPTPTAPKKGSSAIYQWLESLSR